MWTLPQSWLRYCLSCPRENILDLDLLNQTLQTKLTAAHLFRTSHEFPAQGNLGHTLTDNSDGRTTSLCPEDARYSPEESGCSENTGHSPPEDTEDCPPKDDGEFPPENIGRSPEDVGDCPPEDNGYSPPEDAGYSPPVDAGDCPPEDAGYSPPEDAGYSPPVDAGDCPPEDAGYSPPGDAGYSPPVDAGDCPPEDAGYSPPVDAGDCPPEDAGYSPPVDGGDSEGTGYLSGETGHFPEVNGLWLVETSPRQTGKMDDHGSNDTPLTYCKAAVDTVALSAAPTNLIKDENQDGSCNNFSTCISSISGTSSSSSKMSSLTEFSEDEETSIFSEEERDWVGGKAEGTGGTSPCSTPQHQENTSLDDISPQGINSPQHRNIASVNNPQRCSTTQCGGVVLPQNQNNIPQNNNSRHHDLISQTSAQCHSLPHYPAATQHQNGPSYTNMPPQNGNHKCQCQETSQHQDSCSRSQCQENIATSDGDKGALLISSSSPHVCHTSG